MIAVDTSNQTARNLSAKAASGDLPRSKRRLQYVPNIGPKGSLVQLGGNQQSLLDQIDPVTGNLVGTKSLPLASEFLINFGIGSNGRDRRL